MEKLREEMLALLDRLEADGDLEAARSFYEERIRALLLEARGEGLDIAITELREMLFVHPNFSPETRARDTRASIAVIRDELQVR